MIKKFGKFINESKTISDLTIPREEVVKRIEDLNKSYQDGTLKIPHKSYLRRFNALKNINTVSAKVKRFGARVTKLKGFRGIYVYNGKNFTAEFSEDCCETCWWEVNLYSDGIDPRLEKHFYDYNQFDSKGEVLHALLQFDFELSNK